VFRIGILGGENEADRLRNFQCMVDQLPEAIGVKEVKLFPAADYDGTIQGLLGGTLDYAELGASGYAKVYLTDPEAVDPVLTTSRPTVRPATIRSCSPARIPASTRWKT
jgi:phosphonate transport system substrate-binding protein